MIPDSARMVASVVLILILPKVVVEANRLELSPAALAIGVLSGTYSSIFVAASMLLAFGVKRDGWTGEKVAAGIASANKKG